MVKPTFDVENKLWSQGYVNIAGLDEVGRGSFAGPLVAAAVVLPKHISVKHEINDSKVLSSKKRTELAAVIHREAISFGIAEISVRIIDKYGISKATQFAFRKAISLLTQFPDYLLIDAFYIDRIKKSIQTPIIHGDQKSISIAAASIIAKVYRDSRMIELSDSYPNYDFALNKGYGTKVHQLAISKFGLCVMHRTSFNLNKFVTK